MCCIHNGSPSSNRLDARAPDEEKGQEYFLPSKQASYYLGVPGGDPHNPQKRRETAVPTHRPALATRVSSLPLPLFFVCKQCPHASLNHDLHPSPRTVTRPTDPPLPSETVTLVRRETQPFHAPTRFFVRCVHACVCAWSETKIFPLLLDLHEATHCEGLHSQAWNGCPRCQGGRTDRRTDKVSPISFFLYS